MGGKRNEDDGVRETYIGNIEAVGADIFPNIFDYVALGHYHIPSGDSIKNHIRYCGSPIPMGFGEAGQQKCVYIIECPEMKIHTIEIPVFQRLESIKGDKKQIQQRLEELKTLDISVWVELEYIGEEIIPDFAEWANNQVKYSKIEILRIKSRQSHQTSLTEEDTAVYLEELDHEDVFNILLEQNQVSDEQKKELLQTYHEIYFEILNPEL
jgi:exonuclease SbcD